MVEQCWTVEPAAVLCLRIVRRTLVVPASFCGAIIGEVRSKSFRYRMACHPEPLGSKHLISQKMAKIWINEDQWIATRNDDGIAWLESGPLWCPLCLGQFLTWNWRTGPTSCIDGKCQCREGYCQKVWRWEVKQIMELDAKFDAELLFSCFRSQWELDSCHTDLVRYFEMGRF